MKDVVCLCFEIANANAREINPNEGLRVKPSLIARIIMFLVLCNRYLKATVWSVCSETPLGVSIGTSHQYLTSH